MTQRTVAHQAPLSMKFSRQDCWNGLLFPSPGISPTQGYNLGLLKFWWTLHHLSHQGSCRRAKIQRGTRLAPGPLSVNVTPSYFPEVFFSFIYFLNFHSLGRITQYLREEVLKSESLGSSLGSTRWLALGKLFKFSKISFTSFSMTQF